MPPPAVALRPFEAGGLTVEGGEQAFDWDVLVPRIVHPLKVAIIETLWWVDRPLSASEIRRLLDDDEFGLSHISYHMVRLAHAGAIEMVRKRHVRGSIEKYYFFKKPDAGAAG